jgi:microcompartment protein CcmL/EutN
LEQTPIRFENCHSLEYAGVLLMFPALLAQGLMDYKQHYQQIENVYYDLDTTILFLSFMYLCRIHNPEQLRHISPGEFGKLLGLDRIPEARCLRVRIKQIIGQNKSEQWGMTQANKWVKAEGTTIFYVDGHPKVYCGDQANLGKKHISRMKLCMPAIMEFWVNNHQGMPYFVVTGEVNEKLGEMLSDQIIPRLKDQVALAVSEQELMDDPELPRFTLTFDREGYSPKAFKNYWEKDRIAVLTYNKNVKDKWPESEFHKYTIPIDDNDVKMELAEREIELEGMKIREVRKKSEGSHQTSILTTNRKLTITWIAIYMFARWCQENFFKYLRQEYDIDRMIYYLVKQINEGVMVVNPIHSKLTQVIKKTREKISRRQALLFVLKEENVNTVMETTPQYIKKQLNQISEINQLKAEEQELLEQRKQQPYKIEVKNMPENEKYTKLDMEGKLFQNIIKMICYRAETTVAMLLNGDIYAKQEEVRLLVKSIIKTKGDIVPDYQKKTLTVKLYTQSNPRNNRAVEKLCELLTDSETIYPGTELRLIYKLATN